MTVFELAGTLMFLAMAAAAAYAMFLLALAPLLIVAILTFRRLTNTPDDL